MYFWGECGFFFLEEDATSRDKKQWVVGLKDQRRRAVLGVWKGMRLLWGMEGVLMVARKHKQVSFWTLKHLSEPSIKMIIWRLPNEEDIGGSCDDQVKTIWDRCTLSTLELYKLVSRLLSEVELSQGSLINEFPQECEGITNFSALSRRFISLTVFS